MEIATQNQLQFFSLIALFLYFGVLLWIVTKEKKNQNMLDYFFGGRKMPFWALSITFIASWWGAGSALSTADLAFHDGMGAFWYYGMPVLISTFLMILGAKTIRRIGYLTQGEMMKARYSPLAATLQSFLILVFMTTTAASQMVGLGDFFGTYMGLSYEAAIFLGTGIVLIYSVFGGFRGVVLTDIIQFVLMFLSALIVFIVTFQQAGGWKEIEQEALLRGKEHFMCFSAGAEKYISYVITFGCAWAIQANVWQRISATKNNADARKITIMSFLVFIPLYLIVVFTGMAGLPLFSTLPEGGVVTSVVVQYMPPMLGAFVFVGISAAIMSTMDSLINTGAMTFTLDLCPSQWHEQRKLMISRLATFLITAVALVISLSVRSILEVSWIASDIITTGVFIPLLVGFVWRRGNSHGAVCSMIVGFLFCLCNHLIILLDLQLPFLWEQHSTTQVLVGVTLSVVTYVVASLLTEPEFEKADAFIMASRRMRTNKSI
mgnify:CR=1 FL=1